MLKEAIEALRHCHGVLQGERDRVQRQFEHACAEADMAAASRDRLDARLQEIANGLVLLQNSDGLLENAGQNMSLSSPDQTIPTAPDVDSSIDRELKRLLSD